MSVLIPSAPVLPRRLEYVTAALNLINTPYQIGGRLRVARGEWGLDCSGLVAVPLLRLGGANLEDWWTARLWEELQPVDSDQARLGDLFLYGIGSGEKPVHHVTIHIGAGACLSASRGSDECTTPEIAASLGAKVMAKSSYLYRPDFVGARSMARFLS